jgi:hypothetical protein
MIIIFGGVDREKSHFNDAIIFKSATGTWSTGEQKGIG